MNAGHLLSQADLSGVIQDNSREAGPLPKVPPASRSRSPSFILLTPSPNPCEVLCGCQLMLRPPADY
jgi:hypothetical protein